MHNIAKSICKIVKPSISLVRVISRRVILPRISYSFSNNYNNGNYQFEEQNKLK